MASKHINEGPKTIADLQYQVQVQLDAFDKYRMLLQQKGRLSMISNPMQ